MLKTEPESELHEGLAGIEGFNGVTKYQIKRGRSAHIPWYFCNEGGGLQWGREKLWGCTPDRDPGRGGDPDLTEGQWVQKKEGK